MATGPDGFVNTPRAIAVILNISSLANFANDGTVQANENVAVRIDASDDGASINFANGGSITGTTGVILESGNRDIQLSNTGTITGVTGTGLITGFAGSSATAATARVSNSGTITGPTGSYTGFEGADLIFNTGAMIGDINLRDGADRYEGASGSALGTIFGEVGNDTIAGGETAEAIDGGADDDLLVGRGGDDDLSGGTGEDRLIGGDGNDLMDGGEGADTMTGNSGNDTMTGGDGNDLLVGQDGSDSLDGGGNDDILDGGPGSDILEGGTGNDILRGRDGEDDLAGGLGSDLLTGGQDADSFVFRGTADAGIGAARDQILDFEQGLDLIVVAGLSKGVFEFRGTAAFTPSGNPELRLFETPTGSTIVQIDANGNGVIDAEIRVANVTGLTAEDFVL